MGMEKNMSPFELIKSISSTKKDILENEKDYNAFMVNRGLSYFPDTVLYANEMNKFHHLGGRLQYSFLINTIKIASGHKTLRLSVFAMSSIYT